MIDPSIDPDEPGIVTAFFACGENTAYCVISRQALLKPDNSEDGSVVTGALILLIVGGQNGPNVHSFYFTG